MSNSPRIFIAIALISAAICLYAAYPSALHFAGDAEISSFTFLLAVQAIGALAIIVFVIAQGRLLLVARAFGEITSSVRILAIGVFGGAFSGLAHLCVFLGVSSADKAQAAVLYETWPVLFLLFTMVARRPGEGGFLQKHDIVSTFIFLMIGLAGLVLISGSGTPGATSDLATLFHFSSDGVFFGVLSSIFMAFSLIFTTMNARLITKALNAKSAHDGADFSLAGGSAASFLVRVGSIVVALAAGFALEPDFLEVGVVAPEASVAIVAAGCIIGLGGALFTAANTFSPHSNINLLWYFTPIVAVYFLYLFGLSSDFSKIFFVGVIFVITANFALNMDTDFSASYRFSLIALALFSYLCVFYPGFGNDEFFGITAIPISLYAILVAFISNRLTLTRAAREDVAVELVQFARARGDRRLELFVFELLASDEVFETRREARELFAAYDDGANGEISKKIFQLVRSKAGSNTFGETFVLWLLGTGTIATVILSRPPDSATADFIAVIISVAVVFLTFGALDVDNKKRTHMLREMFQAIPDDQYEASREVGRSVYADIFVSWLFMTVIFGLYYGAILAIR